MIIYVFAIIERDGGLVEPCVGFTTAEQARAQAVSFLADRQVSSGEADEMLDWEEHVSARAGHYSTFTAPTKYRRIVRVWPIEIMDVAPHEEPNT